MSVFGADEKERISWSNSNTNLLNWSKIQIKWSDRSRLSLTNLPKSSSMIFFSFRLIYPIDPSRPILCNSPSILYSPKLRVFNDNKISYAVLHWSSSFNCAKPPCFWSWLESAPFCMCKTTPLPAKSLYSIFQDYVNPRSCSLILSVMKMVHSVPKLRVLFFDLFYNIWFFLSGISEQKIVLLVWVRSIAYLIWSIKIKEKNRRRSGKTKKSAGNMVKPFREKGYFRLL